MSFYLKALSFILLFGLVGCATTHPGKKAASEQKDIVLSMNKNSDLSDEYYEFYEYTIENVSKDWVDVQVIGVSY